MDNKRPGEFNTWRQRLSAPGALPGIGLADKEAAWDKLYERLGETRRRRIPAWIRAAAACILLALIPAAILLTPHAKQENQTVAGSPLRTPATRTMPAARTTPVPPPSLPRTAPPTLANPLSFRTPSKPGRPGTSKRVLPHIIRTATIPDSERIGHFYPGSPDLSSSDPMTIIAAAPTPKKELRVVHINELEPPHPATATAGKRQKPSRFYITINHDTEPFRPATTYEPVQADYHPLIITSKHAQNP